MVRRGFSYFLFVLLAGIAGSAFALHNGEQGGNKYKNLVILQDIFKNNSDVTVPPFICISSERVEKYLGENELSEYRDIHGQYRALAQKLNYPHISILHKGVSFLKNIAWSEYCNYMSYSNYNKCTLEELESGIKRDIKFFFEDYTQPFPFTQNELNFFEVAAQQNDYLMVRSTGVEDAVGAANAGGNVSVAYVNPKINDIQEAMGQVVASYFGLQSLKNRVMSGEFLSPTKLTIPVLIQLLVGEKIDGADNPDDIPISGVAYTTNRYLSDDRFSVMEINASYGHGEGVVANKVATDRYFLVPSLKYPENIDIYPLLSIKEERLTPCGVQAKLAFKKNSFELAHKSALTEKQLHTLHKVLKQIEHAYGMPMDVEFVIKKEKIYIVQARPAMYKEKSPSYYALEKMEVSDRDALDCIPCNAIVSGSSAVQVITNPTDIIIAKTLDEADQIKTSPSTKAVLVNAWASPLSHAAVNFMSHGIPCLYTDRVNKIRGYLSQISRKQPLIIDTQRNLIFLWNNAYSPEKHIVSGWFEHPVPRSISLLLDSCQSMEAVRNPLPKDAILINLMQKFKISPQLTEQKALLTVIDERVKKYIDLTERRINTTGYILSTHTQNAFNAFKKEYNKLIEEIACALEQKASQFQFLFYHKMLEALLYQTSETEKDLNRYTYSYFLNEVFEKQSVQKIIRKTNIVHAKELEYVRYCPTEATAQQWMKFVTILDTHPEINNLDFKQSVHALNMLLDVLQEGNYLSLWFATMFYQESCNKTIDAQFVKDFIVRVAQEYTESTQQFVRTLIDYKSVIDRFVCRKNNGFNDAVAVRNYWDNVINVLVSPLRDASFMNQFDEAPRTIKIIACDVMHRCINLVDSSIKQVKISLSMPLSERIVLLKEMLSDFNELFLKWITEIMPEGAIRYHSRWALTTYIDKMQELYKSIMSQKIDDTSLQRSAGFSVQAAMLGSTTAFERHYPETVEDMFMLIHQDALVAVAGTLNSLLPARNLSEVIYIPPFLDVCRNILTSNNSIRIRPIGISYTEQHITLFYNMPLNNHSSTLQLTYNRNTQECECSVQFVGEARDRWEQIAFLARISSKLSGLSLNDDVHFDATAGITSWTWKIEKKEQLSDIIDYLSIMCGELSYEKNLTLENMTTLGKTKSLLELKNIVQECIQKEFTSTTDMPQFISNIQDKIEERIQDQRATALTRD